MTSSRDKEFLDLIKYQGELLERQRKFIESLIQESKDKDSSKRKKSPNKKKKKRKKKHTNSSSETSSSSSSSEDEREIKNKKNKAQEPKFTPWGRIPLGIVPVEIWTKKEKYDSPDTKESYRASLRTILRRWGLVEPTEDTVFFTRTSWDEYKQMNKEKYRKAQERKSRRAKIENDTEHLFQKATTKVDDSFWKLPTIEDKETNKAVIDLSCCETLDTAKSSQPLRRVVEDDYESFIDKELENLSKQHSS